MNFRPALCGSTLCGVLAAAALSFNAPARADVYHAVEGGDTLAAIAKRYGTSAEVLRTANRVSFADDTKLGAMLLRVPDANSAAPTTSAKAAIASSNGIPKASSEMSGSFSGSITKALRYTVAEGDTLDSIAARHARSGYAVSAESIRTRNNLAGQPTAGTVLSIPITTVYRAPVASRTIASSVLASNGFRTISSESDSAMLAGGAQLSMEAPTAREVPATKPLYETITVPRAKTPRPVVRGGAERVAERGPSSLSSRSYSPSVDGVRVLGRGEDAPNIGATPQPRVRTTQPQVSASPSRVATVAKIAIAGARIRRLPDSDAATLYRCATGTEIAVLRQTGAWSAILMSDKSTGWIPSRYLQMSAQQVDISSIPVTEGTYARRANKYAYTGNFSSANPVVAQALTYMGTPYVYGGSSRRGIDCSALVQNSFRSCGYRLPRTAAQQSKVGQKVEAAELREGDRLYFSASGSRVDHTGLYLGNGLFVHASGSGRSVIVSNLYDKRNWNIFVGARR
ncbi:MAG TPA: NlpC/P60 family protein [Abditibacteriaceae bacterium]|jgi:cell wall-associated NlpC family hydrolase